MSTKMGYWIFFREPHAKEAVAECLPMQVQYPCVFATETDMLRKSRSEKQLSYFPHKCHHKGIRSDVFQSPCQFHAGCSSVSPNCCTVSSINCCPILASKEEVLIKVTDEIWQIHREKAAKLSDDFFGYDSILLVFRYFKTYKHFILCVYKAGLAYIYLDIFDRQLEEQIGDMPYNDVGRYKIYFYSGALYNVFLKWLEGGMQETPAAMAQMVRSLIL